VSVDKPEGHAPCMNTTAKTDTTTALVAWRIDTS
jgi:hypothetical protein